AGARRRGRLFHRSQGGRIMAELTDLTIAGARDGLKARKFSAREIARAHLDAMERARELNAFITETPDVALKMADAADARLKNGGAGGGASPGSASRPRPFSAAGAC